MARSHGSRGGGGSHFGGSSSPRGAGGSFGGRSSSSRSSSSSRGSSGNRTTIYIGGHGHYHHGHHHGGPAPLFSIWFFFAVFLFMFGFAMSTIAKAAKSDMNIIKDDYYYYQDMIEYAESREGFILDATITNKFLDYDSNRWYIEYTLKDHAKIPVPSTAIIDPYLTSTYSIYTEEQIKNYRVNDTIKVAVDSIPVTTNTDSMVVEYKNFKIEDDGEYISLSKTYKKFNTISVFLNIGAVVCLISGIAFGVKFTKKAKEYIENNQKSSSSGSSTTVSGTPSRKCGYCGYSTTSSDEKKCPQCGAHLK